METITLAELNATAALQIPYVSKTEGQGLLDDQYLENINDVLMQASMPTFATGALRPTLCTSYTRETYYLPKSGSRVTTKSTFLVAPC